MNRLKHDTIAGIIFVLITGTLSHFIYGLSGNNVILGFFFPISESTWEHMKLCFFPMLLYAFYMNKKLRQTCPCVTSSLLGGILLGTFLIPVFFYTYSGILGNHFLPLDIAAFVASVLLAFTAVYRHSLSCRLSRYTPVLGLSVILLAVCFFVFTYFPPHIGIFLPPAL